MRVLQILVWSALAWAAGSSSGNLAHHLAGAPLAVRSSVEIRDINGGVLKPLQVAGKAGVVFFVCTDCPISNSYAPEIQRICEDYGTKGVACSLLYEDVQVDVNGVRKHLEEFRYKGIPAAIDADRRVAKRLQATVTPEAAVIDREGNVRYRGRIDNFYADFGKTRRQATAHDLRDALDAVLAGRQVANPETHALGCYIVSPEVLKDEGKK